MINITGSVGTGKTKKLCELASAERAIVVCENPERMYTKLHGYGIIGLTCISYSDYADAVIRESEAAQRSSTAKYVIDDVGKLLSFISPETIGFTSETD